MTKRGRSPADGGASSPDGLGWSWRSPACADTSRASWRAAFLAAFFAGCFFAGCFLAGAHETPHIVAGPSGLPGVGEWVLPPGRSLERRIKAMATLDLDRFPQLRPREHPGARGLGPPVEHDVRFHQLAPDGSRIHPRARLGEDRAQDRVQEHQEGVSRPARGKWVIVEPDELKQLSPKNDEVDRYRRLRRFSPISIRSTSSARTASCRKTMPRAKAVRAARRRDGRQAAHRHRQGRHAREAVPRGHPSLRQGPSRCRRCASPTRCSRPSEIEGMPARKASVNPREKKMAAQIVDAPRE